MFAFLDKRLTNLYVRVVNYLHPTPPMAEDYDPADTAKADTVVRYLRRLTDGYGRTHIKKEGLNAGVGYRIDQLYVTDAYHMKQTTSAEHEYVVLAVQVGTPVLDNFHLKIERTWNQPGSLFQLSSEAIEDFKGALSEENQAKLEEPVPDGSPGTSPSQSLLHPYYAPTSPPVKDKPSTPFARSSDISTSSSPDAYASGPANDTVSLATAEDAQPSRSTIVIEHISFDAGVLPLIRAIGMATAVSLKFSIYTLFNHQCYFYAATLMDCCKRAAGERAQVTVPEKSKVRRADQVVSLERPIPVGTPASSSGSGYSTKAEKSTKGGRYLSIPIFQFREKAFDNVTWPACQEYLATMTRELDEITRPEREKDKEIAALRREKAQLEEQLRAQRVVVPADGRP